MAHPVIIKTAQSREDIALIETLAKQIWEPHYTPIIGAAQVRYMLKNLQSRTAIGKDIDNGYIYSIAYLSGRACGYSAIRFDADALFLSKLYVLESCRGQGIARAMLQAAEDAAREYGKPHVRLICNKHNTGSLDAYARLGFTRTADIITDIGGGFIMDDYAMEKKL